MFPFDPRLNYIYICSECKRIEIDFPESDKSDQFYSLFIIEAGANRFTPRQMPAPRRNTIDGHVRVGQVRRV